jgi:hypothetical protein
MLCVLWLIFSNKSQCPKRESSHTSLIPTSSLVWMLVPVQHKKGGQWEINKMNIRGSVDKTNRLHHNPAMLSFNGTTSTSHENNASIIITLLLENKNEITDQGNYFLHAFFHAFQAADISTIGADVHFQKTAACCSIQRFIQRVIAYLRRSRRMSHFRSSFRVCTCCPRGVPSKET